MTRLTVVCAALVLPLAALLFLQWPLRELVAAYSREANDAAQVLFAMFIAVAISAASRRDAHLAARSPRAASDVAKPAPWRQWALLGCLAPWALLVASSAGLAAWQSLAQLERFPETGNPGYFLIKITACLLPLLVLAELTVRLLRRRQR